MAGLKAKRLFLLDMDGTIYRDTNLFDGTLDFLDYVKSIGGRSIFMTNNSSRSVDKYVEHLTCMGIPVTRDDFVTSAQATILYLKEHCRGKKIYAETTKSFMDEMAGEGLDVTDEASDEVGCLVLGFDKELTFKKLNDACILLGREIDYVASNPDLVCPTWYGSVPDCGSVTEMLYNATGKRPVVIGKPKTAMVELALSRAGYDKAQTLVVGDRLNTDIACGVNAGVDAALVLTGESTRRQAEEGEIRPTYIFEDIASLLRSCRA